MYLSFCNVVFILLHIRLFECLLVAMLCSVIWNLLSWQIKVTYFLLFFTRVSNSKEQMLEFSFRRSIPLLNRTTIWKYYLDLVVLSHLLLNTTAKAKPRDTSQIFKREGMPKGNSFPLHSMILCSVFVRIG